MLAKRDPRGDEKDSSDDVFEPANLYDHMPKSYLPDQRSYPNFERMKVGLPFRLLSVGTSSSGKTTSVLDMLLKIGAFSQWVFIVKRPDEPLYRWVIDMLKEVADSTGRSDMLVVGTDLSALPPLEWFKPETNSICIVDDMCNEKEAAFKPLNDLFIAGRKQFVSLVILQQSYSKTEKVIRQNCDLFMIKEHTQLSDLRRVLSQFGNPDELMALYKQAMQKKEHFLLIDTMNRDPKLRARVNYGGTARGGGVPKGSYVPAKGRMCAREAGHRFGAITEEKGGESSDEDEDDPAASVGGGVGRSGHSDRRRDEKGRWLPRGNTRRQT